MEKESQLTNVFKDKVRLDILVRIIWQNRKKYILPISLTMVLSSAVMLCIPRYYRVQVMLAPEYSNNSGGGLSGLNSLAGMVGINLGGVSTSDAITPMFYPDLISANDFIVPLMDVKVSSVDGNFEGRYVDYLMKYKKAPFWTEWVNKFMSLFRKTETPNGKYKPNPYRLTKEEDELVKYIRGSIDCNVDKKTDVITLCVTEQDPLIAAQLADTIKQCLQDFITEYRTKKTRSEVEYYTQLYDKAREDYLKSQQKYADFADSHYDVVLNKYKIIEEKLENDMQAAYNVYNSVSQQKILSEAKLRERTPAFTTIQNACVPVKHAGPKRMITVAALSLLAFIITTIVILLRTQKKEDESK